MSRVSYNRYPSYTDYVSRGGAAVETAIFNTLTDIDKVLDKLKESIKTTGSVSLAKYYETIGAQVLEEDSKYGWTNLLGCEIVYCRCGYELSLPKPQVLNSNPIKDVCNILKDADEENFGMVIQDAMDRLQDVL